jgi:hypothetical protein
MLLLLVAVAGLAGCHSVGLFDSTTPRLTGRVLNADTGQPLSGVKIVRLLPGQSPNTGSPPYGAQLLLQGRPVLSAADGSFAVSGTKYMTFLKPPGQWSARLMLQATHNDMQVTNFTAADAAVNSATNPRVMNVGDVRLLPKS